MTAFRLVVRPDGQAILTTTEPLSRPMVELLARQLADWADRTFPGVVVIPDCDVVQIRELELALEPSGEADG